MKKLIILLFIFIGLFVKGQDIKPISPLFKNLQTPSWSYYLNDSSVWIYKGSVYGWTKLMSMKDSIIHDAGLNLNVVKNYNNNHVEYSLNKDLDSINTISFTQESAPDFSPYKLFADTINKTLAFYNDESYITMQVGQEMWSRVYNNGTIKLDGKVVRINGSFGEVATVELADNRVHTSVEGVLGVVTHDIEGNTYGFITTMGEVHELDTSLCPEGGALYVGQDGALTHTRPIAPNFVIQVATCIYSHVTNGKILVNVNGRPQDIIENAFNGSFIEGMKFTVTSDGTTITGTLQLNGGGDLTAMFSDGFTTIDCTPAKTIILTAGTATIPQTNWVYLLKSTKDITTSTSGWPAEEHIKISEVACRTAALTQADGVLRNQNWNDHIAGSNGIGHLQHVNERVRRMPSDWFSGTELSVNIVSTSTPDDVYLNVTGGKVYQMHLQDFPAQSMPTDDIHIVNHFTTPYSTVMNLNGQLTDALGATLANRSFSIVIWGVQNETGENSHLMANLPIGSYSSGDLAEQDALNYSVYSIPSQFRGVGFLIARVTFSHSPSSSGVWTLDQIQDLRGYTPNSTAGGGAAGSSGITTYLGLTDTPNTYVSSANKIQGVNAGETAIESKAATVTAAGTINIPTGQTYQINSGSIIVDAINDGTTTTAPSQNAVFDALALKEPANANIQTHITNDGDLNAFNEMQDLSRTGDVISLSSDATTVDLSDFAKDADLTNYEPTLTKGNLTESITGIQLSATREVIGGAADLSLTFGYVIPTTTQEANWTSGYNDKINSLAFSGTTTKTLTLTQQDVGTVSNTFTDIDNQSLSDSKVGNNITIGISGGTGTTFSVADGDSLTTNELNSSVSWNNAINEITVNDAGGNKSTTITGFLEVEVDGSISNEGQLTVAAGASNTSIINSNTSGQTGVTLSVDGTNMGISEAENTISLSNLKPDQVVGFTNGTGISTTGTYPNFTITNSAPNITTDLSFSGISSPVTLNSSDGTDVTVTAGVGISLIGTSGNVTITNNSPNTDQTITLSGDVSGTGTTSIVTTVGDDSHSHTTSTLPNIVSSVDGVINDGGNIDLVSSGIVTITPDDVNNQITISATEVDGNPTNELQDLSLTGNTLSLSSDATTVDLSAYVNPDVSVYKLKSDSTSNTGYATQFDLLSKAPASGSANYVQVSPASAQSGNILMGGSGTFGNGLKIDSYNIINRSSIFNWADEFTISMGSTSFVINNSENTLRYFTILNSTGAATFASTVSAAGYKLSNTDLLIDNLRTGSIGASGTILTSVGASSQPTWQTVNQVIGGNSLSIGYLPYWDGGKLVNTNSYYYLGGIYTGSASNRGAIVLISSSTSSPIITFDATNLGSVKNTLIQDNSGFYLYDETNSAYRFIVSNTGQFTIPYLASSSTRLVTASSTGQLANIADGTAGQFLKTDGAGGYSWQTISTSQVYKGTWDASSNTPTLANGTGTAGWYYRCVVSGTVDFGAGNITFAIGDDVYYNGSAWEKIPAQGYTLQTASPTVLGGVKIGSGVSIDGGGAISVSTSYDASGTAASAISSHTTTYNHGNFETAYNDKINSLAFSGTTTKTLTLTQQDGGTVSNTFTDIDTNTLTSLSAGTINGTSYGITSDGGSDDIILPIANTTQAGLLSAADKIRLNNVRLIQDHDSLSTLQEKSYNSLTDKPSSFTPSNHGNESHTSTFITDGNTNWDNSYGFIVQANAVVPNVGITGDTKTKITYDSKGLVTAGADATTADIASSTDKRYVTDAQLIVIGNTAGTNNGDETQATIISKLGTNDNDVANEGSLSVLAGASNTSLIHSNTTGSTDVTIQAGTGLSISESGNTIVLTNTQTGLTDGAITYERLSTTMTGKQTVTSTIDFNASGIGEISLAGNTTFSFTNLRLNKIFKLKIVTNGYTVTLPTYCKNVVGSQTITGSGTFYLYLDCWNSTGGSEEVLLNTVKLQ